MSVVSLNMSIYFTHCFREFCGIAKKIFIYTTEEVKKMSGNCKLPGSASDGEEKIVSIESETKCEV